MAYISTMPKQSAITTAEIANLVQQVREIILSARARAARSVDAIQIAMNFAIGQRIVEHEQGGDKRAAYGKRVVESLAKSMTSEFGRGRVCHEPQADASILLHICLPNWSDAVWLFTLGDWSDSVWRISCPADSPNADWGISLGAKARWYWLHASPTLGWICANQLIARCFLMGISNPDERLFYEIKSARQGWDIRTLKRQVSSCLYERLALSRDKDAARWAAS